MLSLLRFVSWPEWRHHPWRHLAALIAVTLGVALAFSVELINRSALGEFSAATRAIEGTPDFEIRGQRDGFDEALYARVARHPQVALASPVIEIDTYGLAADGERHALKLLGIDALVAGAMSPEIVPRPDAGSDRLSVLDPHAVYVNAALARRLGRHATLRLQTTRGSVDLEVRGRIAAAGPPLAVMDIAGAQDAFGWLGRLSRIDVRLVPGADRERVLRDLALPAGLHATTPADAQQRVSNVSRAYRVNLTVLALVALFTGAFLVFSILALSVAKRTPQLALLGVLGLDAATRLRLVLIESALLGAIGSLLGLALGTGLAALGLRQLAGDLGGGYFPGVTPGLQFSGGAALVYGLLGVAAALVGGWLPARAAASLAPAQALKGLVTDTAVQRVWIGPSLVACAALLACLPPVAGIPLAAYLSVACLLLGGMAAIPAGIGWLLAPIGAPRSPTLLLAVERARRQRHTATVAVAGVVASLSLAVALTVMVASFREAVRGWLDVVLPADLYVRTVAGPTRGDAGGLPRDLPERAATMAGVRRIEAQRIVGLRLNADLPDVTLIARPIADPARALPLVGTPQALPSGAIGIYASEAMAALYGAQPGTHLTLPLPGGTRREVFVRALWHDYARQHGAVLMDIDDYRRLTGDRRIDDLALWLAPGTDAVALESMLRRATSALGADGALLEFASATEIRATSLRLFDRSFAVTYWLQAVAIAIGLFGIAASFSAQVLARRKEFGLLAHLGLTHAQVLGIVAGEGAAWTAAGALLGLALGIAVSIVLVKVVNPQSFHWTMDLLLPWPRLALLCAAVVACGTLTAWIAGRGAAGRQAALSVKEDW
ncbi:MAG: FtsX-like permease family protein [Proteobacteria bacterium]|nr:FtsX-like permease family protein [Pseudomonadota bacterium]